MTASPAGERAAAWLMAAIDSKPGNMVEDSLLTPAGLWAEVQDTLRNHGYRNILELDADGNWVVHRDADGNWAIGRWWPSAARCAELARTATGERREQLLRGVWL